MEKTTMRKILVFFEDKYEHRWEDVYEAIRNKEKVDCNEVNACYDEYDKDYKIITIIDEEYPEECKCSYKPPFVIFEPKNAHC